MSVCIAKRGRVRDERVQLSLISTNVINIDNPERFCFAPRSASPILEEAGQFALSVRYVPPPLLLSRESSDELPQGHESLVDVDAAAGGGRRRQKI